MDTGDLIFWCTHSLLASLIHIKSKVWNHVSMIINLVQFEGEERRKWVAESIASGPSLTLLSHKIEHHNGIVAWAPLKYFTQEQRKELGTNALKYMGVSGYDYWTLFRMLCTRPSVNDSDVVCSEYIQAVHNLEGKVMTPEELSKQPFLHELIEVIYP